MYSRRFCSCSSSARFSHPASMCSRANEGTGGSAGACAPPLACGGGAGGPAVALGLLGKGTRDLSCRVIKCLTECDMLGRGEGAARRHHQGLGAHSGRHAL